MDWIEEKTEQLWVWLREKTLWKSLVCYLCIGMLGVGALYWVTRNLCLAWVEVVSQRYQESMTYHSTGIWRVYGIGSKEKLLLGTVNFFYQYCLYFYSFLCFCLVGKIFLERNIKPPLHAIARAINDMKLGNYGKEVIWQGRDEMGALCGELEQMRKILLRGKKEQWKQQEVQRRINAAFAHDIRTPLTVLQGYTEFLQKYVPKGKVTEEMLLEKLGTMRQQEERLLSFSRTMATIQDFEKWELTGGWYCISEIMGQMEAVIQGIRPNTGIETSLHTGIPEQRLFLDRDLVVQVFENLLSNGLRYAKTKIQVEAALKGNEFTIYVRDDGPGFSDKALRNGPDVYFSEEKGNGEHFGIGLSICRMLCENHGGSLTLKNSVEQGAISAALFTVGLTDAGGYSG